MYPNFIISILFSVLMMKTSSAEIMGKSAALVIDTTGSMSEEVHLVKILAIQIIDKILSNDKMKIEKLILVPFNDPLFGPALTTNNAEQFKSEIEKIKVDGGGDCPEMSLSGINIALEESLMNSYIYVFTDAQAKDPQLLNNVLNAIQQKRSQVVIIMSGTCNSDLSVYTTITDASSKLFIELGKGNLQTVFKSLEDMIEEQASSENILVKVNPAGQYNQTLTIDDSIKNISISVVGEDPQINVIDPEGRPVTDIDKIHVSMNFPKIKVVHLIDPAPGNWTITSGSSSEHTLKVSGVSDVRFDYGFYTDTIEDITDQPIEETTRVVIEIHDEHDEIKELLNIEILDINGTKVSDTPLIKTMDKSMYKSMDFLEFHDGLFYLAVVGVDNSGNIFGRVSPTAIKTTTMTNVKKDSKLSEKLKSADNKLWLEYGKRGHILCNVTDIYEPVYSWRFPDGIFVPRAGSKVSIHSMADSYEGIYECTAFNEDKKLGQNITVLGFKPPHVKTSLRDKYPIMFAPFELTCRIGGSPPPVITWFHNDVVPEGVNITTVDDTSILSVDSGNYYHSGEYKCVGKNKFGQVETDSYVEMRGGFDSFA